MNRLENGTWSMVRSDNGKTVKVEGTGRFTFTDDDTDVKTLDPGGFFSIETKNGWSSESGTTRVVVTAANDGSLSRTCRIEGKVVSEAEGRKWLAAVLPEIVRDLAIGADTRVARILAASGPAGVLDEIARIKSGWARHVYFVQLFDQASLDSPMLARSLRQAGQQVDSDFARSEVARKAAERFALDDTSAAGFADLVNAIESDFEARRALGAALIRPGLSPSVAARLVKAAIPQGSSGVESDFEMAELLQGMSPGLVDALGPTYLEAVASIGSDFERKRVLAALARRPALPLSQLVSIADLTASMGSDFERAEVLLALARHQRLEGQAKDAVLKAAERLGSEFERGRVLAAVTQPTADTTSSVR
jgi:bla regulator protein blaR1